MSHVMIRHGMPVWSSPCGSELGWIIMQLGSETLPSISTLSWRRWGGEDALILLLLFSVTNFLLFIVWVRPRLDHNAAWLGNAPNIFHLVGVDGGEGALLIFILLFLVIFLLFIVCVRARQDYNAAWLVKAPNVSHIASWVGWRRRRA